MRSLAAWLGTCLGAFIIGLATADGSLSIAAVGALLIYASALSLGYTAGYTASSQD